MFFHRRRIAVTLLICAFLAPLLVAPISAADNSYQCDNPSGAIALINACGARWQAANVRSHVAAGSTGGTDSSCLMNYADLLEQLASKWSATKVYTEYAGPWPCGSQPSVASDDGILAQACPNAVWSYENLGVSGCIISINSAPRTVTPAPPSFPQASSTGCATGSDVPAAPPTGAPATLRIGTTPSDDGAEVFYALQLGFFAKAGLTVEVTAFANGAAGAAAVAAGALDVAFATIESIAAARSHGIPFVVVAPGALYSDAAPQLAVTVATDSGVGRASDLSGRVFGVTALRSGPQLAAMAWMDANGGDSRTTQFVELPSSAMAAAVSSKRIDAAIMSEPFLSAAVGSGSVRVLDVPQHAISTCFLRTAWISTSDWAQSNRSAAQRFFAAMSASARWANTHPAESAVILAQFAKLDPSVIQRMKRTVYAESFTTAPMQPLLDALTRYGMLSGSMSQAQLVGAP